ncbi:MAG: Ribonuclease III [Candidatus Yanofskybacteria bacterium GW2011_GWF2_43_596]|nr:MAG: Ribonuclease III [Candidatus Yanofskybacteria bacterium GW2011_GWF2_43_596]
MSDVDVSVLEKNIGGEFEDKDLLLQALTHRSYINENPKWRLDHNERLEFLGDAVLELVITEYLYNTYPNPEGEMTNWRASLVNANMLSKNLVVRPKILVGLGNTY